MTPDVQLSSREAAAIWGIAPSTWRDYVAEGRAPEPDGVVGNSNWWWRHKVVAAFKLRPGQGARSDLLGIRATVSHRPRSHCKRGHEFTPENTYVWTGKSGTSRTCKECKRIRRELRQLQGARTDIADKEGKK